MGDPACYLAFTCLSCGRFLEEAVEECPHCGAEQEVVEYRPSQQVRNEAGAGG